MKVLFHISFLIGDKNLLNLTDYPNLNDYHTLLLSNFEDDVVNNIPVCGTNKRSNDCNDKSQIISVNKYEIYHYHIDFKEVCSKTNCLKKKKCFIPHEKTNFSYKAIIHYCVFQGNIIIFGFSPNHVNNIFPKFYLNPLKQRLSTLSLNINQLQFEFFMAYCDKNKFPINITSFKKFIALLKL